MAFDFYITQNATEDFQTIYDYIKNNLHNESAAEKLTDKFEKAINQACSFPKLNPSYGSFRKIIVGKYIIFYTISEKEKKIIIHAAVYGARDYETLLSVKY